jgi:hypothetical protein
MSLQLRARWRAAVHIWTGLRLLRGGHDIWRVFRWWGWDTKRVFCSCGKEFTRRPPGSPSVDALLAEVAKRRAEHGR